MSNSNINMKYLVEEFDYDYNKERRDFYYTSVNDSKEEFRHQLLWRNFINKNEAHITFFNWYEMYCEEQNIPNPFINIYDTPKITQDYRDIVTQETISSIHPPKDTVIVEERFIATPLISFTEKTNKEDSLRNIVYQNNYSNEILNTISKQLNRLENNQNSHQIDQNKVPSKKEKEKEENPIFIPFQIDPNSSLGYNKKVVNQLEQKLSNLNINVLNQETNSDSDSESKDIKQINEQFTNRLTFGEINHLPTRNYYHRPTLPDIQYEDNPSMQLRSQYDGSSIYEWNIDGLSEHQIVNIVQEMNMASNAYITKGNDAKQITGMLISGFTGILRNWWDMYVSKENKECILNAKKVVIKTENNQQIQNQEDDSVATLIYSIIKNFIGDPSLFQEKSSEILLNLTCRKLQDYRWYKDMFLTKVMLRPDCKEAFWKERFIAGLPRLFAERIRQKLREEYNNQIPYTELTYGQISSYVNKEGLAICSDLKLKAKIKRDRIDNKEELGNFCQQYGYENITIPTTSKSKRFSKKYSGKKFKTKYDKTKLKDKNDYYKTNNYKRKPYIKFNKDPYKSNESKDTIICYKCGKTGHMSKDCYVKKKINELQISEQLKTQISKLILNDYSSSNESSISDYDNQDLNVLNESSSTSSDSETCECLGNCTCFNKINVITKEDREMFELLDQITDQNIKNEVIKKFLNYNPKKETDTTKPIESFNLQEIFNRFSQKDKLISTQELQEELTTIKAEIIMIKERLTKMEKQEDKVVTIITNKNSDTKRINIPKKILYQRWHTRINICIKNEFKITLIALIDSGADMNVIQEKIIPKNYYEKTSNRLSGASGSKLNTSYKVSDVHICKDDHYFKISLILVKNLTSTLILGAPFIHQLYPINVDEEGISTKILNKEIKFKFTN